MRRIHKAAASPLFKPARRIRTSLPVRKVREMFLRKVDGPRSVTLPDGRVMTRADLPPPETRRWVASRKIRVVEAVVHGLITLEEALERYALSEDEFNEWRAGAERHGKDGLKVTLLQKHRQL